VFRFDLNALFNLIFKTGYFQKEKKEKNFKTNFLIYLYKCLARI
jgi:hypothetical protein